MHQLYSNFEYRNEFFDPKNLWIDISHADIKSSIDKTVLYSRAQYNSVKYSMKVVILSAGNNFALQKNRKDIQHADIRFK